MDPSNTSGWWVIPQTDESGSFEFVGAVTDITELRRIGEMEAALVREQELFARQRATELAKANEALLECLDALASVPELDKFLGQVMGAITRQLGATSSVLRLRNFEKNVLTLDLVFQDARVMTAAEAEYPDKLQTIPLDEWQLRILNRPATVLHLLDNFAGMPDILSAVPDRAWSQRLANDSLSDSQAIDWQFGLSIH